MADQNTLVQAVVAASVQAQFGRPLTDEEHQAYDYSLNMQANIFVSMMQAYNTANSGS